MQTASIRIWTPVIDSIFSVDNRYIKRALHSSE